MFRSRKTKRDGDKTNENVPVAKLKRRSASELAAMIQKVQLSADVVEKDILDTEEKLNFDIENARNNKDFQYKQRNSDNLADAEKYLQELFINVDHVKKMKHPQSEMIKKDVHQLHDRWDKLCTEYRRVYEQVYVPELRPKVDWLKLVEEKQYSVNRKGFGNDLVTVEKQLAEHNIIHKEIEAYHPHIRELEASPEYANRLKDSYGELLSTSGHRQEDLTTLHVFMQSCTQQLMWLDMEQEERKQMDWSDRNTDYESRSRKYEDIVNKDIVEKEMAVNSIQDEGDRLLKSNHPAKATIMAHMDALDSDWKKYLNLLICEEAHLRFMTDYHKFRKDVNEVKDQIDKKNKEVDRRYRVDSKDSAFRIESLLYDIQEKQKETDSLGEAVQALQARSHQIVPLKFRHEKVQKPLPVEALCDFEEDEMTVQRGDKVMLKDNMDPVTWLVADSSGMTKPIPSTCLVIPPTDSESISLADGLTDQYSHLRQKLSYTDGMFRQRLSEVQQSAPSAETDGSDEKECVQYISDLEKVYSNMDDLERKMLFNLKTPLDKSKPADDAKDRVKQHQEFAKQLKILQSDKNKAKHAADNFLKRTPKCSSSSKLYSKINENEEKYINVSRLTVDYGEKIKAANSLESSLKKTNEMLLPNEQALTQEFTLPGDVSGIRARRQELKTIKSDLRKTQQMTDEAANNLRNTKQQCMTISTQYNEQCPDISRQESQLHRLQNRQSESLQETEERLNRLEESEKLLSNYNTSYNSLDMWLNKLPKHELTDHETPESLQKKVEDQTKLVDEIRSKEKEETAMENLGHEYLSLMQDYEKSADRYRYTVEQEVPISRATISQEQHLPGEKLQEKERNMIKKYTEASAANEQHLVLLKNMQNYQKPEKEKKAQQIQVKSHWTEKDGQSDLQKLYGEEMDKRKYLEGQLGSLQKKTREEHETLMVRERKIKELELKFNQTTNKEVITDEKVIIKEGAMERRDLEEELERMNTELTEEKKRNKRANEEITLLKKRSNAQEETKPKRGIQNVTQTAVKSDPGMLKETEVLKTSLSDLQNENSDLIKKAEKERKETENKMHLMQKKIHEFEQQPKLDEKVIIKEVAKTEKDPATEEELNNLRKMLEDERKNNKAMNDEINHMQKKYITLEQSKQKLLREEVVTPDPDVEKVVANLKKQISELQQKLGDKEKEIDRVQKEMFERKKQAGEERSSKEAVERNFTILQKKVHEIEQQPPKLEENVIIKEVAKVEKDPQMVEDLQKLSKLLEDEKKKNKAVNEEINQVQKKYLTLEKSTPKEVTKEVVKPDLEVERSAANLKKQVADKEKDIDRLQKEMFEYKKQAGEERSSKEAVERNFTILQKKVHEIEQQPPKLEENVIIKEVAKVEKDPQMLEELQNLTKLLEDEKKKNKAVNEEMNHVQKKYVTLEKSTPKEVTKEVVKPDLEVEKLAAKLKKQVAENEKEIDRLQKEMFEFKKQTGVERSSKEAVERNFTILQKKVHEIEQQPPKLEENVIIKEVAKVEKDPQMLEELQNLTKLLEDEKKKNKAVNEEMNHVQKKYVTLEKSTPKEVTKEVVKPDLEVEKLAAKLKKQVAENEKEIDRLQKEMFEFKKQTGVERSSKEAVERNFTILQKKVHEIEQQPPKLEENVIIKEVAKVEKDPQMLEELQNLTKLLEDEKKKNKAVNEEMNHVQKKYVTLEKSTPKEVTKEVVKPDLEVEKLAAKLKKQVAENEKEIDRLQKEMFEFKKQTGVERSSKEAVERNFTILQKKVHEIEQQPPKLEENVIIKEVAKVEKDPQMLEDLQNLTKLLEDEKKKNKAVNEEMNHVQKKYVTLEKSTPKEVTKEVVKPDLEVEKLAAKLKKQVAENEKEIDRLQKEMFEFKKQTGVERSSKEAVERNFTILQKKVHEIEQQPPKLEENVIIKEVAKVEKDPQMLEDLQNLTKLLEDEKKKNKAVNEEMNHVQKKYVTLEKSTPKEVTKEVVKPDLEVEKLAAKLKKQVAENEKEIDRLQKEMFEFKKQTGVERSSKEAVERNFTILQKKVHEIEQQPPKLEENVIIKEVAKVEKDPQMLEDLQNLTKLLEDEKKKNKAVNEEMNHVQKKYVTLEKSTPKEVTKEVVKPDLEVEKLAAKLKKQVAENEKEIDRLQKEMFEFKKQTGVERSSKEAVERNFTILQKKVHEIEQQPPKLEENVIIKEVAKVEKDPQMLEDLQNLTKLLEDEKRKNKAVNEEMNQVQKKYLTLEKSTPREVVKPDLEVERLAEKLKKQVAENEKEIDRLQKEMFEYKKQTGEERSSKEAVERNFTILQKKVHEIEQQPPKLEENVIIKEVAKVEKDPQMVVDLQNLTKLLEDEKKKNKVVNEEMNQVQKKYVTLEKSTPKEVIKEVVKPDLEVERSAANLKKQVADKEKDIDRLQKEMFEYKKQAGEERSSKEAVERNFTILQKKVHEIEQQPPKLEENVIIKEVAKVEKDPQMVVDLQNLTKLLEDEKKKNKAVNEEMNQVQKKYLTLEKSPPKEVVKPDLEVERLATKLKKQVAENEKEIDKLQKEMFEFKKQAGEERSSKEAVERNFTILQKKVHEIEHQPPKLEENVIIKEVAKVEKDPQMLEGLQNLSKLLEDEKKKNKAVNEEMNQVQKKYVTLEKSPPKEVIREVVKPDLEVERLAEKLKKQVAENEKEIDRLQKEMFEYKKQTGEERSSKEAVERNFTILQKKVHEIEQQPPKLVENVIIKEVAKVEKDPQMVEGLQNLTKLLEDEKKKNKAVNEEMNQVQKKYLTLEKSTPKEVIKEVMKPDLEVERLAEKLKKQVAEKEKEIDRLQKEMFESKKQTGEERSSKEAVERNFTILQKKVHEIEQQPPKLEENVIIKEVAKVEKDPQMVEGLQNLTKLLEDEKKKNKAVNEEMNQVQKKYLTLEKSPPKEVIREVVKPDLEVERMAEKLKKQVADKEKEIDRLQKEMFEYKKQAGEERSSKEAVERNFTILQKKVHEIEQQPPKLEENVIIKEVAKVEKDPQMVEGLQILTKLLEDEKKKNKAVNEEMNQVQKKYLTLEKSPPKEVIREVVKPDLEVERLAEKLKKEVADKEKEIDRLQKEMFEYKKQTGEERSSKEAVERNFTILQKKVHEIEQQPPKLVENVIIKEVAKVEKDPQMVEGLQNLTKLLEDEKKKNKAVNEEMNQVQKKYLTLEKSPPKEVIREVVKPDLEVERMAEKLKKQVAAKEKEIDRLQKEMFEYKKQAGEERSSKEAVERNFTILQKKVHEIEQQPPKLEENVIIKEVAKVEKDPQMVEGLQNLTKLLEDEKKKNIAVNEEMNQVQKKYLSLEKSTPKEVIKEVVKPDLEVERMAEKLKKQVADKEKDIDRLQKEMFEYKKQAGEERSSKEAVERNFTILQKKVHEIEQQPPKLEENVIIKEVAKVEKDPQMVEGLQNLTKLLEDEKKKNKAVNEEMNQVQKKYLTLEKSPPKEVIREVVKPDLEVERMAAKLKKQVADNEKDIDRLQKEMFEYKKQAGEERSSKEAVERNFTILQKKVHEIEQLPPKLEENVIIKEVAKVEKDPQMLEGLQNLTKLLEDEKKKNKAVNEEMNQVQKKYLTLEKSTPKEVIKEVVKPDLEVERMAAKLKKQVAENEKEIDRLQKEMFEYKKQAGEERSSKEAVERNFTILQKKVHEIEQLPPKLEENVIIKEVAKVEKDPQMVEGLQNLTKLLEDEKKKNEAVNEEMNRVQKKYVTLEKSTPKEVIKEVVKADPNTERKALSLEKQLNNEQKRLQEAEINLRITREEILRLRNRPPEVKFQDVVKVERDPQQDHEISELKYQVQEEKDVCRRFEREVIFLKEKLLIIENAAPKVEVKEVLQEVVKPDPKTEQRAANLSKQLEEEKCLGENLKTKINNLQLEIVKLQNKQPEVHIQEVVKLEENPQTLEELSHLKELLDDEMKKSSYVKRQLLNLQSNYDTLATEKAKVEVKEVVHEVIRPDPETEKVTSNLRLELQRLKREADGRNMEIENLKEQIIALQNKPPEIQTKETIKEIIKYERSVVDEEELSNIRDDLDKESKKRMDAEFQITKLEGKIFNLENRQPEIQEKVVVQKSVEYKTDPALEDKVNSCQRALEQEQKLHHLAEENLQDTRERVSDQLTEIKLLNEQLKNKYEIEHELKQLKLQITILEKQKKEAENNVQIKEVVKLEKDPTVVKEANNLRYELKNEQKLRNNVENDKQNLMAQVRELKMQGEKEKIVYQEVVKIERDEAVDQELSKFKTLYDEETQLSMSKQVEIDRLAMLLSKLTKDMEELKLRVSDNELLISSKDMELVQLLRKLNDLESKQEEEKMEEMRKTSHISKRVTVVDPDTGKKLSPYEAYKAHLIDWDTYKHLQNQEKEWELLTITGPKGKRIILRDHKSGQEYPIDEAIKQGFISENDFQKYEGGELSITDIAAKIAGPAEDILDRFQRGEKIESNELFYAIAVSMLSEGHPIAGVYDMTNETKLSVQSAVQKSLIDTQTSQRLLEAQAATGGIIDINTTEKCSVHQALERGLVGSSDIQKLISAQKAFTGIEDAVTRERLSVGEALKRGWLYEDAAYRYLEAQHVTGGLVDPSKSGRVPVHEAKEKGIISSAVESYLNNETSYIKDITDPSTKEQITYKQALDNCFMDESTGFPLLKANAKVKSLIDF